MKLKYINYNLIESLYLVEHVAQGYALFCLILPFQLLYIQSVTTESCVDENTRLT